MNPHIETRSKKFGTASRQGMAASCCHSVDKPTGAYRLMCVTCKRPMGMSRVRVGVVLCAECISLRGKIT